tara:strand:- start:1598 stop:2038 length:441 start_codon:yes stop_codon:yes gene_type:complete
MDLIDIEATQRFNDFVDQVFNSDSAFINSLFPSDTPNVNIMSRNIEALLDFSILPNHEQQIFDIYITGLDENIIKNANQILKIDFDLYSNLKDVVFNKKCPICTEDFKDSDKISKIDCKHAFHEHCIMKWGKYKNECPTCRKKLPV